VKIILIATAQSFNIYMQINTFSSYVHIMYDPYSFHSFCSLSCDRAIALPKQGLHTVQSSASSFNFQYPLIFLRPSGSCLHLVPHLPIPFNLPSIVPSVTCFKRQILCKMWWIKSAFLSFNVCKIFSLYLTSFVCHFYWIACHINVAHATACRRVVEQLQEVTNIICQIK